MLMIGYLSHHVASTSANSFAVNVTVFRLEPVRAVAVEFAGGAVERERNVGAGHVARLVDRLDQQLQRRLVGRQIRREPAFVADGGRHAPRVDEFLQRVKHLGAVAQRFAKRRRAERHQHEFLQIDAVVRVRAAIDDVHLRHRQLHFARAAEIAVKRQRAFLGRGLRDGARHGEERVGAEPRLVVGAVEVDQRPVDQGLLGGVETEHGFADLGVDVLDGLA